MKSSYDIWNRIVIAKHQGRIVSTCLLIFPEKDGRLEIEDDMNQSLDPFITDRSKVCEITRLAALSEFRGNDLFIAVIREAVRQIISEGRETIFCSADEKISKFYEIVGKRKTGIEFYMDRYKGIKHYTMVANVRESVLRGKRVNKMYWPHIWKPVAEHFYHNQREKMTTQEKVFLKLNRAIFPIVKMLGSK